MNLKDSKLTGVFLAAVCLIIFPTVLGMISGLLANVMIVPYGFSVGLLSFIYFGIAAGIPVYLRIKGLRVAMKAYLLTLFIPLLAVMLLFGSCLLIFQ